MFQQAKNAINCSIGEYKSVVSVKEDSEDVQQGPKMTTADNTQWPKKWSPPWSYLILIGFHKLADAVDNLGKKFVFIYFLTNITIYFVLKLITLRGVLPWSLQGHAKTMNHLL